MSPALAAIWAFWWLLAITAPVFFIAWTLLGIRLKPKNCWLFLVALFPRSFSLSCCLSSSWWLWLR